MTARRIPEEVVQACARKIAEERAAEAERKQMELEAKKAKREYKNLQVMVTWNVEYKACTYIRLFGRDCDDDCTCKVESLHCPSVDWTVGVATSMHDFGYACGFSPAPGSMVDELIGTDVDPDGALPSSGTHFVLTKEFLLYRDVSTDFCRGFVDALHLLKLDRVDAYVLVDGVRTECRAWRKSLL